MNSTNKAMCLAMMPVAIALVLGGCNREGSADDNRAPTEDAMAQDAMATPEPMPTAPPMSEPLPATEAPAPGGTADAQLAMMDSDGDGKVTAEEHAAGAGAMFTTMDTDGNGSVTAAEMDASQQALHGDPGMTSPDKIKRVDSNGDGILSREEHVAGAKGMFEKMDGDGDGALTAAEWQAGHDAGSTASGGVR